MVNLPGSVLWICLFVHLIQGQILDNISAERVNSNPDDAKNAVNETKTQRNEDEEKKENGELEAKEEEAKIRQFPMRSQESNGAYLSESAANGRGKRRRITYRAETGNVTEYPQISMERRKSYLSIAERRKFYNRTRVQGKKTESTQRDVLLYQETSNRPTVSQERILLMNEIRENKQNDVKDSSKTVTEGRNDTQNQRIVLGTLKNETLPKMDNVNQSVIHSHMEFGQKLSLRRTTMRAQDLRNVKPRRRKEKTKEELTVINSTNKFSKNIETQSTKLLKVDVNHWSTTKNPRGEVEAENFVMPWKKNKTNIEKVGKYIKSSPYDSQMRESLLGRTAAVVRENILPVPLTYEVEYTEVPKEVAATEIDDSGITIDPSEEITTTGTTPSIFNVKHVITHNLNETDISLNTFIPRTTTTTTATTRITTTTTGRIPYRKSYHPSVEYKPRYNYTRRPLPKSISTTEKVLNKTWSPSTTITERAMMDRTRKISHNETRKWRPSSTATTTTTTTSITETGSNAEKYPLTIEINENNKRVLSEMFWTTTERMLPKMSTVSATKRYFSQSEELTKKKGASTEAETENALVAFANVTTISAAETTVPATSVNATVTATTKPDARDLDEDHKSVGTSFNTKFYIIPNVTKTEVIKIVETEEDAENEVLVTAQTVGIAIYILAAFGLIPLLLALIFGAKFFVRKHRRKDDCDSDLRSDISGNENHLRQGKIGSELKKSPSNVTTTTLVATTRLPRVHHWENYEKNTNKNWEFPRSKLKLLTILGQGNFGQVWKAEAEEMAGHDGLTRLVAVKTVKEGATDKEHGELIKELEIMQQMGSHPNIVTLLGCCTDQEPYYLIMEYVMYGKLLTYLREHRTSETYYNISNSSDALTSRDLTVFAYCVARGMEYLSSRGIIHRDLAARNVLVDHNKLCKIADFGMSRSVRDSEDGQIYEERQHKGALPIRWMAPESLLYSIFTHKSDVWSFGIVLWEIVTLGSTPYPNMGAREVMKKVREGYRLERPPHCRLELYQLISRCWAHDPNKRPDFGELRRELTNLLDDTSKDGIYVDLDSFAVSNRFHVSNNNNNNNNIIIINSSNNFGKTNDFRLIERNEFKTLKRLDDWDGQDWHAENRKVRCKRTRNNGKGTVTLTGHGSFTVNSRILEKEFKMV